MPTHLQMMNTKDILKCMQHCNHRIHCTSDFVPSMQGTITHSINMKSIQQPPSNWYLEGQQA